VRDLRVKCMTAIAAGIAVCLCMCASALASDVNISGSCGGGEGSPGFRGFLPDCRAYELVTPSYAGGEFAFGVGRAVPPMSADGDHVLSLDYAGFAGAENLEENFGEFGAIYEFSRTTAGWTAESLEPPAWEYPRREFLAASSDLDRSLWALQTPERAEEELPITGENGIIAANNAVLAVREAAGGGKGRFALVGPVTAPQHIPTNHATFGVVGASSDLSHILLQVQASEKQPWPGDKTVETGQSLYEYEGEGDHEPSLVGVTNMGPLSGSEFVNEDANLLSECGTVLGSKGQTSLASAVSASGDVVFFTALAAEDEVEPGHKFCGEHEGKGVGTGPAVNEVYARVDNNEGDAHTVAISEPTTGPDGDCESCDDNVRAAGVFEGASEDGSRVFFDSEQALLPGAIGESLYEYDFDASNTHERVSLIAPDVSGATVVSGDGGRVYFESEAALTKTANANGETAAENDHNLYVYDGGEGSAKTPALAFVAREASVVETTHSGEFLVFSSSDEKLVGAEDTSTVPQLFEYDAASGTVARVSIGQRSARGYECEATHILEEGYDCDGNTTNAADVPLPVKKPAGEVSIDAPTDATTGLSVSRDGRVVFMSRDALTPASVAGGENVYEYDAGDVYLISPGSEAISVKQLEGESRLLGISESGQSVFFSTTERLVPQDIDSQSSWYDAREYGGFAVPPSPPSCTLDTCQGPLGTPPVLPPPGGSAVTPGGGNAPPPLPSPHPVEPKSAAQIKAKKLAKTLEVCSAKRDKRKRAQCERTARKNYRHGSAARISKQASGKKVGA
jgi:hypothetical protein